MKVHVIPRHLRLTSAIEDHAITKFRTLGEIAASVLSAHVVLGHSEAGDPHARFTVSARLAIAGPDLHAEHTADDLHSALDAVVMKLARQLRKRKTRMTDKPRSTLQRAAERKRREATT